MKQDKEPKKIEMGGFGEPQHLLLVVTYTAYLIKGGIWWHLSRVREFSTKKLIKLDFATIHHGKKSNLPWLIQLHYYEMQETNTEMNEMHMQRSYTFRTI